MAQADGPSFLLEAAVYLGAAVIAVPLFNRLKLGSVLGYLAAGVIIGPHVLGPLILGAEADAESRLHFAEFGVVLLLFVIGLELRPQRLWQLRRDIFGLGAAQVMLTGGLLAVCALLLGFGWQAALVAGLALALSSTAFALQLLGERQALNTQRGERAFSILLFQDLAIVPLLALVAALSAGAGESARPAWLQAALTLAAVGGLILIGRFGLTPLFRLLAAAKAREVLAAAALLVVVASALLMASLGLSMALGAFLAGVMLADSEFRHQLEADIEPFRGMLLGLFFIAVGMNLDLTVVAREWLLIGLSVLGLMAIKAAVLIGLLRLFGSPPKDRVEVAATLSQGGEFAFVLFTQAAAGAVLTQAEANLLSAVVILSMALTPLAVMLADRICAGDILSADGLDGPEDISSQTVIVAGYGRVGQVVAQMLAARGFEVTRIDTKPQQIQLTRQFGVKVFYGDGTRLDVLRAAGAASARLLVYCVDGQMVTPGVLDGLRAEFPQLQVVVRVFDRRHLLQLLRAEPAGMVRETFESAVSLGRAALETLGEAPETIAGIEAEFRRRDSERLALQAAEGNIMAGRDLIFSTGAPVFVPVEAGPSDAPEDQPLGDRTDFA